MKKHLLFIVIMASSARLFGQQTALFTQYMFNPFALNPAVAGTYNFFQARSTHRFQWVGFSPDAPITNSLSIFGPMTGKNKDMGYGGTLYSDVTGPVSRSEVKGAYAYNIAINDQTRVSFGASLGLMQYKIDLSKIKFFDKLESDLTGVESYFQPNGMAGVYLYSTNYQVSVSADNLFANKFDVDPKAIGLSKLKRHFYIMGAYNYFFTRDWMGEGSVIFKAVYPAPLQMDINARIIYHKEAWFGISYRTQDALSVLAGYIFNKRIYIGYSFDYNISSIRQYNLGSHELMIGYKFNALR